MDLTAVVKTVRIFNNGIRMEFGLDKCTRQVIVRGNIKLTDLLDLDIGKIRDIELHKGYKYLGMLQNMENKENGQVQGLFDIQEKAETGTVVQAK